ncbi:MAG: purine/pyrimidine permease [Thermoanaerobacteraceae bacterium]|nr:purine/pyrimidine permease [Thermoanaerobacteraceae bacterium]
MTLMKTATREGKVNAGEEAVWEESVQLFKPLYGIEDRPKNLLESILYGWQHTLVDISPFVLPLMVATAAGVSAAESATWVSRALFAMGIATLIMTIFGNRLPLIQGPSATLVATLSSVVKIFGMPGMWGSAFGGALLEMLLGASGVLGLLRKVFPISVSAIVVTVIGIDLGKVASSWMVGDGSSISLLLALVTIIFILALQYGTKNIANGVLSRGAIFFSIWIVGLGLGSLLGKVDWALVASKPWISIPSLFPYGGPGFGWEFPVAGILGMFVAYIGSMVESLGDYASACAVCGEQFKVKHMNRGIMGEGLGSAISTFFGGMPCTTYTQNIGIIATTRIASRYVVQIAAIFLMLYGVCPKFGALIVAIPRSVIGAVFVMICGSIAMSGLRLISAVKPTSVNAFIIGFTLVASIGVPIYTTGAAAKWVSTLPSLLQLFVTNSVIISIFVGVISNLVLNELFKIPEDVVEDF